MSPRWRRRPPREPPPPREPLWTGTSAIRDNEIDRNAVGRVFLEQIAPAFGLPDGYVLHRREGRDYWHLFSFDMTPERRVDLARVAGPLAIMIGRADEPGYWVVKYGGRDSRCAQCTAADMILISRADLPHDE